MTLLHSSNFNILQRSLDAASLQHKVIANNIANVDTPHFKRSEVSFAAFLNKELANSKGPKISTYRTNAKHIEFRGVTKKGQPIIVTDERTAVNNGQNNVDIDYEMALHAKAQLFYDTMIEQVNYELRQTRTAIGGRG